jgi:hypothetical protein
VFRKTIRALLVNRLADMVKNADKSDAKVVSFNLPKIEKTDNPEQDKVRQSKRNLLSSMVTGCLLNEEHILPLYDEYMIRIRKDVKKLNQNDFRDLTYIYSSKYESFLASWILSVSTFTAAQLVTLKQHSPQNIMLLAKLGLQLFEGLKFTDDMRDQTFVNWFYTKRHETLGMPLATLDPDAVLAGAAATGTINLLEIGRYKAEYDSDDSLIKLTHVGSGDDATIDPSQILLKRSMAIQDAHSDFGACFIREPRPAEFLHTLFGNGKGPHSRPYFGKGSVKIWRDHICEKYKLHMATLVVVDASTAKEMQSALKAQSTEKRKAAMTDVHAKNKQRLKTNIGQRRFSQSSGTAASSASAAVEVLPE